jgi:hypothetical protein
MLHINCEGNHTPRNVVKLSLSFAIKLCFPLGAFVYSECWEAKIFCFNTHSIVFPSCVIKGFNKWEIAAAFGNSLCVLCSLDRFSNV